MNIENHINNAKKALDTVREKVAEGDFETSLAMLCNLMTENRELIAHVFNLHALKEHVELSVEDNVQWPINNTSKE